jgi:hypothetical protein
MDYWQSYWIIRVNRVNAGSVDLSGAYGSGKAEPASRSFLLRNQATVCWRDAKNRNVMVRATSSTQAAFSITYPGERWKRFLRRRSAARAALEWGQVASPRLRQAAVERSLLAPSGLRIDTARRIRVGLCVRSPAAATGLLMTFVPRC